jgi:hypothetical protein
MTNELTSEETAALTEMEADVEAPTEEQPAEEPVVEPESEAKEEAVVENKPTEKQETVSHAAFHAKNEAYKEMRDKAQELERRLAEIEEAKAKPEPEWRDPLVDPEGHRAWAEHQARKPVEQIEAFQKQQQAAAEQQRVKQHAEQLEQAYIKENPDYMPAATFLHQQRMTQIQQEAQARGEYLDEAAINGQIGKEVRAIYDAALAAGMNPAELIYAKAKSSGYATQAPQQSEADKLVALAQAEKQTKGLGGGGGQGPSTRLTAEQIANMSEAEIGKMSEEDIARAFGG